MMAADFSIGNHKVLYTTSQPFGAPVVTSGRGTVEYLVGHRGDPGETVLQFKAGSSEPTVRGPGVRTVWNATTGQLRLDYTHTSTPSDIRIGEDNGALTLRVIDRQSARTTWQLESTLNGRTVHTDVEGAYLAGQAVTNGSTVALTGQMAKPSTVSVIPDAAITSASWNGQPLPRLTDAPVPGPDAVSVPTLHWVSRTGAPEAAKGYDDSAWKIANSTTGRTPWQKPTLGGAALDSNLLGFYEGSVWYRAHFTAGTTRTLKLNANGGQGAAAPNGVDPAFMQVWINGAYAGAHRAIGNTTSIELPSSVKAGDPVVLSVVVHNLGQNLDWSDNGLSRQSRGLNSASLPAKGAVTWRVRGALSTEQTGDTARTMYNNGDLYGERAGWYLPGMPDKDWTAATTMTVDHPGIRWYRSTFNLSVPTGQDTTFQVVVKPSGNGKGPGGVGADHSQATIFVNGWNTGVYVGDVGPQTRFVIPAGFINLHGSNTIAVAVAAKEAGSGPASITVEPTHSVTGSLVGDLNKAPAYSPRTPDPATGTVPSLVPLPASLKTDSGAPFTLKDSTVIVAKGQASESAKFLATILRRSTGFPLPIVSSGSGHNSVISLTVDPHTRIGTYTRQEEAYSLVSRAGSMTARAVTSHGLFDAVQTIRQLFPPLIESTRPMMRSWTAPAVTITDAPRFSYRSIQLDPARSFLTVNEVRSVLDVMAAHKMSVLHMHLADDQGWRIQITNKGRAPGDTLDYTKLTSVSGHTAMDTQEYGYRDELGRTGFYTQQQYRSIVAYAAARHIMVVPEIDSPAHSNAMLHAFPELNSANSHPETTVYGTVPQNGTSAVGERGAKLIISKSDAAYLDQKYTPNTAIGLVWASNGHGGLRPYYDWDPASVIPNSTDNDILGIEGPQWSETIRNGSQSQYLAFPRALAHAEIGWTPQSRRSVGDFLKRMADDGARLLAMQSNFYDTPEVTWGNDAAGHSGRHGAGSLQSGHHRNTGSTGDEGVPRRFVDDRRFHRGRRWHVRFDDQRLPHRERRLGDRRWRPEGTVRRSASPRLADGGWAV